MLGFVIGISIATSIFLITSIVVIIKRKQKEARNVGFVIEGSALPVPPHTTTGGVPGTQYPATGYPQYAPPGVSPVTQYPPTAFPQYAPQGGITVTQYPTTGYPPAYQENPYSYPANPASCQVTVQMTVAQPEVPNVTSQQLPHPPVQQRVLGQEPSTSDAISVLPKNDEKRLQSHTGAVESVSQI